MDSLLVPLAKNSYSSLENNLSRFDQAIPWVLNHEGGFVDHPNDPGGATNFGISLRFLHQVESGTALGAWDLDGDGDVDADDMKLLTKAQAIEFYRKHFWYDELDQLESEVNVTKLFDMSVNMGKRQAGRIFQRTLIRFFPDLKVDGWVGPATVKVENMIVLAGEFQHQFDDLMAEQAKFYFDLVNLRPSREVFLLGWLRRAYQAPY